MSPTLKIITPDGDFSAYVARPAAASAPAVVVIQEIFGASADMHEACDNLAAQGYLAICPDLFWRMGLDVDLSHPSEMEWNRGLARYSAFDVEAAVSDIGATMLAARTLYGASGKVGAVGYCRGGLMTFLTAARRGADAAVAYDGGGVGSQFAETSNIAHPMLMHVAEEDEFISRDAQQTILAALKGHPLIEIHTYPGCRHAFAQIGARHYDAVAAKRANARTLAFLQANLG
jgi:carboxymethylenebutenolidase